MSKTQSVKNSEEYKVKFWFTNTKGFAEQQTRSYYFSNRNSHKEAERECRQDLLSEGIKIDSIVNCTYC